MAAYTPKAAIIPRSLLSMGSREAISMTFLLSIGIALSPILQTHSNYALLSYNFFLQPCIYQLFLHKWLQVFHLRSHRLNNRSGSYACHISLTIRLHNMMNQRRPHHQAHSTAKDPGVRIP